VARTRSSRSRPTPGSDSSAVDFVLMKVDAIRIRRPKNPKDAFDPYAYASKKTPVVVAEAIAAARERDEALQLLQQRAIRHSRR